MVELLFRVREEIQFDRKTLHEVHSTRHTTFCWTQGLDLTRPPKYKDYWLLVMFMEDLFISIDFDNTD